MKTFADMAASKQSGETQCPECELEFRTALELEEHFIAKHEDGDQQLNYYQTIHNSSLKSDINSVHDGARYDCNQCDYQAKIKSNLRIHMNSIHEGIMNYACDQCNYISAYKRELNSYSIKT